MKISIFSSFASFIIFLMVEVFAAQIIKDYVLDLVAGDDMWTLILIIISGFLVGLIISIISGILASEIIERKYTFIASALTFIINLLVWITIAYISIISNYDVFSELSAIERIIVWPKVLAYYAIYRLSNVTNLWLLGQMTYSVIFALMLKLLNAKKQKKSRYNYKF